MGLISSRHIEQEREVKMKVTAQAANEGKRKKTFNQGYFYQRAYIPVAKQIDRLYYIVICSGTPSVDFQTSASSPVASYTSSSLWRYIC